MSAMFDLLTGKASGETAELKAREEYALDKLGLVLESEQRLRSALVAVIGIARREVEHPTQEFFDKINAAENLLG